MRQVVYLLLFAGVVFALVHMAGRPRTWTDNKGKEISAKLVGLPMDGENGLDKITLQGANGSEISVSVPTLSESDQTFVRRVEKGRIAAMALAAVLVLASAIWLIVVAFGTSVLWGILVLLVPICDLVYTILHWDRAWRPFVMGLYGYILIGGIFLIRSVVF